MLNDYNVCMKKIIIVFLASGIFLYAHTLWIDDRFRLHQGHMNNHHADESRVDKKEISAIYCLKKSLISKQTYHTLAKKGCSVIFVQLQSHYYTKTPYGIKKIPKNSVKMPLKSWLSIESVKRLYRDEQKPFNQGLEVLLRNNFSEIKVGEKARLSIYFDGKPLKGAVVSNGHKTIGVSDSKGFVNVKIRHKGLQNLKASYTLKGDGVKCDEIIHTTTLNFEVKQ